MSLRKFLWVSIIILPGLLAKGNKTFRENPNDRFLIMAYYAGNETDIERYDLSRLTHIIYSFCYLDGNSIIIPEERIPVVKKLSSIKKDYPDLKIILALGGWGGCETCSEVFSTSPGRSEFALSVKELLKRYQVDGIDLDWEYPAIPGYPGHPYKTEDRRNFTLLIKELRNTLGNDYEIGFAAGAFPRFFKESVEWEKVMPHVDYVNIMTYDLVAGGPRTGHHTPLFSTDEQTLSVDFAVNFLDSIGVERSKMVIGAAFYARVWENVDPVNNGLYQSGSFLTAITYNNLRQWLIKNEMTEFWDESAMAPYAYSAEKGLFATYDNNRSVGLKTRYSIQNQLGGIMFWQLGGDNPVNGLLQSIYREMDK